MNTTNKKLTKLIAGRIIKQTSQADGRLLIEFMDGSLMKIKSAEPAPGCVGREVKSVRQSGTCFELIFTDVSSYSINLAEETSAVMLRDAQGTLEYAD